MALAGARRAACRTHGHDGRPVAHRTCAAHAQRTRRCDVVTMRAVAVDRYGPPDVARLVEVPKPVPRQGEVLVRVIAAAVTSGDARIRGATFPPGFALPARL